MHASSLEGAFRQTMDILLTCSRFMSVRVPKSTTLLVFENMYNLLLQPDIKFLFFLFEVKYTVGEILAPDEFQYCYSLIGNNI